MTRWAFDAQRGKCHRFTFTGCAENSNNFRTLGECERTCGVEVSVCGLPIDPGTCTGSEPRWGYDSSRASCVEFYYSGCGGNENRFRSHDECDVACRR